MKTQPIRIAILGLNYHPEATGNAPYTASLAEGLLARGYEVRVITAHPHYPQWKIQPGYGAWQTRENKKGVRVERRLHHVPANPTGVARLLSEISFGIRLLFSSWGRPDIVLLVSPALFSSAIAGLRARWGFRKPVVAMWVQDLYSLGIVETGQGGNAVAAVMRRLESSVLRGSAGVAVIHDRFKAHVVGTLDVDAEKVAVIRNWSHLAPPPQVDRASTRAHLGWGDEEIVVLHAGNMGAKQGLENLVEAAQLADEAGLPLRFVLMGDGNQRARIQELAQGVQRLTFVDSLPDDQFQHALASADVLMVNEKPGVAEMSVPSKLTSYFSTGLPVLAATDEGSVTAGEIEASGGGLRVDAGDPRQLVEAALMLGQNAGVARGLGISGVAFREKHLSEDAAIDHYSEWLTGLLAKRCREANPGVAYAPAQSILGNK